MKIRKPVNELTLEDLRRFPVWEFALDEESEDDQDETTVRPHEVSGRLDPSEGMFIVAASFTLADDSKMLGYLTPPIPGENDLGIIQPQAVDTNGQVGFWCGACSPSSSELEESYRILGREASRVFPIKFESTVELVGGPVRGSIPGFLVLSDIRSGETRTVV